MTGVTEAVFEPTAELARAPTPAERKRAAEDKRDALLKRVDAQYEEQEATDAERRLDIEAAHGATAQVKVPKWEPPFPTCALVRTPSPTEYKRYTDQVGTAVDSKKMGKGFRNASELLARACWVYPVDEKERGAMLERWPGLLTPIGACATALAEGRAADEGKD